MFELTEIDYPAFGQAAEPPVFTVADYRPRLAQLRERMREEQLTHLLIYADREHFANLAWVTGFDPRFEEALLILRAGESPLILVGNECQAYLPISPLFTAKELRHEVYQPFSLPDQPRDTSRTIAQIFQSEGIARGATLGCVGWKTYSTPVEIDLPAYLVDAARALGAQTVNATGLFIDTARGLRTLATAREIALFEYTNGLASEGMKRVLFGLTLGETDRQALSRAGFDGFPQSCHWTCKTGPARVSLASPRGQRVALGQPFSANISYWGANCCRSAWVARGAEDLPAGARDYVDHFAGPYFAAMAEWFSLLEVGTPGGEIHAAIARSLPFEKFGIFLNPGHLIHLDEWTGSPVHAGSPIPLESGMVLQSDVIPASKTYGSTRLEDTYVVADLELRLALRAEFPEVAARCDHRRAFMMGNLGIELPDDVLPLSNLCGLAPPYLLRPNLVLTM
ncbi:MAG: M24 family metallopeptidase [Bryobacteraceae bacterium]|nr:M24 family metallopeptidase [Bryobacteraceae bacterium]